MGCSWSKKGSARKVRPPWQPPLPPLRAVAAAEVSTSLLPATQDEVAAQAEGETPAEAHGAKAAPRQAAAGTAELRTAAAAPSTPECISPFGDMASSASTSNMDAAPQPGCHEAGAPATSTAASRALDDVPAADLLEVGVAAAEAAAAAFEAQQESGSSGYGIQLGDNIVPHGQLARLVQRLPVCRVLPSPPPPLLLLLLQCASVPMRHQPCPALHPQCAGEEERLRALRMLGVVQQPVGHQFGSITR